MKSYSSIFCLALISLFASSTQAEISQVFIYPGNIALVAGATQQFNVFALDAQGNEVPVDGTLTWSADSSLGTIDQTGLFRAGASTGRSTLGVRAALSNGLQGGAIVEVLPLEEQAGMVLDHVWKQPLPGCFDWQPAITADSSSNLYVTSPECIQRFSPSGAYAGLIESFGSGKAVSSYPSALTCKGSAIFALCGDRVVLLNSDGTLIGEYIPPPGYSFWQPKDVAVDDSGNVYVADNGIKKFSSSGQFLKLWQTWWSPVEAVACIGSSVYVVCNLIPLSCDCPQTRIQRFDREGNLLNEWGTTGHGDGEFWVAGGIAKDPYGRICIIDKGNRRVQVFSSNGIFIRQFSVDDGGEYSQPQRITIDGQGRFYVTYSQPFSPVRQYDSSGKFVKQIGLPVSIEKQPRSPESITLGPASGFFVSDSWSGRIYVLNSKGDIVRSWQKDATPASLRDVTGYSSYFFTTDWAVHAISKFNELGSLIATIPVPTGYYVSNMETDSDGNLYIADEANKLVYALNPQGQITQQWGKLGTGPSDFTTLGDIAIDDCGFLYVCSSTYIPGEGWIRKYNHTGVYETQWSSDIPSAVAARNGMVLVGEWQKQRLMRYDTSGNLIGALAPLYAERRGFRVSSICIDNYGNPHIVDSLNDCIYSLTCYQTTVNNNMANGTFVYLKDLVVTAGSEELGDCFYVESKDRSSGIKVVGKTAARGEAVTLSGIITTQDGERVISATSVSSTSNQTGIDPLGAKFTDIGGTPGTQNATWAWRWVYNPTIRRSEYKWIQLPGLSNTGLLMRTWGKVDSSDNSTGTFIITDGNKQYLKCRASSQVQLPAAGQFVCLTGISSTEMNTDGELTPLFRIRCQSDIEVKSTQN